MNALHRRPLLAAGYAEMQQRIADEVESAQQLAKGISVDEAVAALQDALAHFVTIEHFKYYPLTSRKYAEYAQAHRDLNTAQDNLKLAQWRAICIPQ